MNVYQLPGLDAGIAYHDLGGPGPVCVYLHGLGSASSADYPAIAGHQLLAPYRSILIDLLGFGFSDRAESFSHIVTLHRSFGVWTLPSWAGSYILNVAVFSAPLVIMEIWQRRAHDVSAPLKLRGTRLGLLEGILLIGIVVFWQTEKVPFIYFQF